VTGWFDWAKAASGAEIRAAITAASISDFMMTYLQRLFCQALKALCLQPMNTV
jgi:hypothetical protein